MAKLLSERFTVDHRQPTTDRGSLPILSMGLAVI